MRYTRLYNDSNGETHFEEAEMDLALAAYAPPAPPFHVGPGLRAEQMVPCVLSPGWFGDRHPTPHRQFWIQLSGEIEVTVTDGETRRFTAGAVVLVEDTVGKGHVTRNVGDEPVRAIFVQLPEADA